MRHNAAKEKTKLDEANAGIFDQLIALNHEAFDLRRFSTAYHALAAAQSWANEEKNEKQLALVEKIAKEELAWIDLQAPKYEHSTRSAKLRGHTSIYANLERQAHSAQLRIGSRKKFDQLRGIWPIASFRDDD